ncbi:MAG: hypothetical protein ACTH7H_01535, partial [Cobetia crustatorum]
SNASTASSTTGMPAPAAKLATSTSSEASRGSVSVISDDSEEEDLSLEDYFQHFVLEHQDHMSETELARRLGISRKNLWERRQRLGIPRRKGRRGTPSA